MTEFRAIHRHAPIAARKVRPVMDMVRGEPVERALDYLRTSHRRGARMIDKVLRSAVANAEQLQAVGAGELYVKTGVVNDGPLKQGRMRWRPGAMGRIKPIRKRTSHIQVVLGVLEDGSTGRRAPKKAAEANQEGSED